MTLDVELQGYQVGSTPRLSEEFFARHSAVVAMDLLGRYIIRKFENDRIVVGQIREVGAYHSETEGSSAQMKNAPGIYSVNNRYGNNLFDVATETEGFASCVQLRGAAFDFGGIVIANGPGKLSEGLGIDQNYTGQLAGNCLDLWFEGNAVAKKNKFRDNSNAAQRKYSENCLGFYKIADK